MDKLPSVIEPQRSRDIQEGALSLEEAQEQYKRLQSFIKSQMREGRDFGVIPGCKKPSLYKPGAEKLLNFNGLGCRLEAGPGTVIDWKEPFFNYEYKAVAFKKSTGTVVAESFGSCNSKEAKYRYNWVYEDKIPKGLKKEELVSEERRSKAGGKFTVYRIDNNDPFSFVNTFQKMAQKRALLGTALIACRASDSFTMDLEEEREEEVKENENTDKPGLVDNVTLRIGKQDWNELLASCKKANVSEVSLKTYLANKFDYLTVPSNEGAFADFSLLRIKDLPTVIQWIKGG